MENKKNSLSTILSEAMKNSGISVEKLSIETGVSERFILLLLEDDIDNLPPIPYLHGYVVKIFEYFNIDGEKIWKTYFKNSEFLKQSGKNDRLPENRFSISRINNKVVLVVLVIIVIPVYFILSSISSGDLSRQLSISNLDNEVEITATSTFLIKGSIGDDLGLLINNDRVNPDSDGDFELSVELTPGFNTINFLIEGSLGKRETVTRQIFYEAEEVEEAEELIEDETPIIQQEEFIQEDFSQENFFQE